MAIGQTEPPNGVSFRLTKRHAKREACLILADSARRCAAEAMYLWPDLNVKNLQAAFLLLADELQRRGSGAGEKK